MLCTPVTVLWNPATAKSSGACVPASPAGFAVGGGSASPDGVRSPLEAPR
jgi:hypothetical protein